MIKRRNDTTVFFNGNSISYTNEIARRVITIAVRYQDRTRFTLGDIAAYAREHRSDLLANALTLWTWLLHRPIKGGEPDGIKSFPEWSDRIANGLLELTGTDIRSLLKTNDLEFDADRQQREDVLIAIATLRPECQVSSPETGNGWFEARDLLACMLDCDG